MCAIICKIHTIYHTYYANYTTTVCSVHIYSIYMKVKNKKCFQRLEVHRSYLLREWYTKKSGDTLASEILYTTIFTVRIEQEGV